MLLEQGQKIVFAGDSVTDDGRKRPVGEGLWGGLGNGYVSLVDTFLTLDYPELSLRCVNMGNAGDTSRDLLARWDTDVAALSPDWVVLCIGFNDVWRQFDSPCQPDHAVTHEDYRRNLCAMAEKTEAKMIFMTPYYLEPNRRDPMRRRMDEYGAIMKEEAEKRGILCIDLQESFAEILKYRYPAFITWDRVHPGRIGSMVIARAFLRAVGAEKSVRQNAEKDMERRKI